MSQCRNVKLLFEFSILPTTQIEFRAKEIILKFGKTCLNVSQQTSLPFNIPPAPFMFKTNILNNQKQSASFLLVLYLCSVYLGGREKMLMSSSSCLFLLLFPVGVEREMLFLFPDKQKFSNANFFRVYKNFARLQFGGGNNRKIFRYKSSIFVFN
jgi:hypothetical protein